ncbi:MAG: hypothetical protein Fur0023_06730 [Bacteroidia bacterium]
MKKIVWLILVFLLWEIKNSFSQQLPQFSQYMLYDLAINPAAAGKYDYVDTRASYRYQWIGITDAPRTFNLSVHGPIAKQKMGLGINIFTDIVGPTRREGANLNYSYHLTLSKEKELKLAMGLYAGFLRWGIDGHKLILHDAGDENLLVQYQTIFVPDFGAGLHLYNKKGYFGIAIPQIYQSPLKLYPLSTDRSKLVTHIYANGGYQFNINDDFKIEPSFLMKYVKPVPIKIDVALRVLYKDQFWIGGSYRTNDAWCAMAGIMYNNYLIVGYSFDFTTTALRKYNTGTHEILVGMRLSRGQSKHWEKDESGKSLY